MSSEIDKSIHGMVDWLHGRRLFGDQEDDILGRCRKERALYSEQGHSQAGYQINFDFPVS